MALVYRHRRLDKNEIFYVGISKRLDRPYSKSRGKHWLNIVNKTQYSVEIIAENIDIQDAIDLEILLISLYGRKDLNNGTLVNKTDGGEGIKGIKNLVFSEEHKNKISKSLKGKTKSLEFCNKLSISLTGRKLTVEHISNISKSKKGVKKEYQNIKVSQYNKSGEFIKEYESIQKASIKTGVNQSHIGKVCRGKRKTAGGFIWKHKLITE